MAKPHRTLTLRERRQMTRDILRIIAEDGAVFAPDNPATNRLIKLHGEVDGEYQGSARVLDSLVEEGLLTPVIGSNGRKAMAQTRGITTLGLRELDRLEHPMRTYFQEHLSTWLLVGLTAIIAIATAITAAKQLG